MHLKYWLGLLCCLTLPTKIAHADQAACALTTAQAIQYVTTHEDMIWPGIQISKTPVIIHFYDHPQVYAYNFTPAVLGKWQKITLGNIPAYYMDDDFLYIDDIEFGYKNIDGQNVYVYKFFNYNTRDEILFSLRALLNKRFANLNTGRGGR